MSFDMSYEMIGMTMFGGMLLMMLTGQRVFAAMACCTNTTALFGDMLFLPALLAWLAKR